MQRMKAFLLIGFLLTSVSPLISAAINPSKTKANISVVESSSGMSNTKTNLACTLTLMVDGPSGTLTIRNNSSRPVDGISAIFTETALEGNVTSTSCDVTPAGGLCVLTFTPGSTPVAATSFVIKGRGTISLSAVIQIGAKPVLTISAPVQSSRVVGVAGVPLNLTITNTSPIIAATGVDVTNKGTCALVSATSTDCALIPHGESCTLTISSTTPYVPCTITVSGTNTANSPTTLIAFSHLGGLVFSGNGVNGQVAIISGGFISQWTLVGSVTGAVSLNDGAANSAIILPTPDCNNNQLYCAVNICSIALGGPYYLPAPDQLRDVHDVLCSNNAIPCNFGNFSNSDYWSSTEVSATTAYALNFPAGGAGVITPKEFVVPGSILPYPCILDF